jgi:hypothetical protein
MLQLTKEFARRGLTVSTIKVVRALEASCAWQATEARTRSMAIWEVKFIVLSLQWSIDIQLTEGIENLEIFVSDAPDVPGAYTSYSSNKTLIE